MRSTWRQFAKRKAFQRRAIAERVDMLRISYKMLMGHVEIVPTQRIEGNKIIFGGYSIEYDEKGKEVRRTQDEPNVIAYLN